MLFVAAMAAVAILSRPKSAPAKVGPTPRPPSPGDVPMIKQVLSMADLRILARQVGFPAEKVDEAVAVAMAESGGDQWAQGDPKGPSGPVPNGLSKSFGLWQVHIGFHPEFQPTELLKADYAGRAAFLISRGGADWHLWSTHMAIGGKPPAFLAWMPGGPHYDGGDAAS